MADQIVIEGVRPYDGRYVFDLEGQELTTREWGWIKRLAGYLPLTIEEGLSDPELITVFAVIALHRAGKIQARDAAEAFETMSDAPFGSAIVLETEPVNEEGKESDPPQPEPNSNSSADTSGPASQSSETSQTTLEGSGIRGSGSLASVPTRLVS